MPAAAVIPAPIAYIKVVAVKKLVVGFRAHGAGGPPRGCVLVGCFFLSEARVLFVECGVGFGTFTLKKLECSKQAFA